MEESLKDVKLGFQRGYITKDEYAGALRAYQQQKENTTSAARDEFLAHYPTTPTVQWFDS